MIKNLFQHVNLHYISIVIFCIIIIFAYGNYRCLVDDKDKENDPFLIFDGPPLFESNNWHLKIDRWSFTHIGFFAILGFFHPKTFWLSMIGGITWELFEQAFRYYKPKWLYGACGRGEWWYHRWNDIIMNCIGFVIGMNLSKIM